MVADGALVGSDGAIEKERLVARIAALKSTVMRHDEAIAALSPSASTSDSAPPVVPAEARALTALLKTQLAELHAVLLDKDRAIQTLRLKVCWPFRASPGSGARSSQSSPSWVAGALHAAWRGGVADQGLRRRGDAAALARGGDQGWRRGRAADVAPAADGVAPGPVGGDGGVDG